MTRPWLRLYRDAINNPKVGRLTLEERGLWASLLMLSDDDGSLPTIDDIAWSLRLPVGEVVAVFEAVIGNGLVTRYVTEGVTKYRLHDWAEHQRSSDHDASGAERQKRWRERQKAQKSAVSSPVTERNALHNGTVTPPDTDTDTDKNLTSFGTREPASTPQVEVLQSKAISTDVSRETPRRAKALPSDFVIPFQWIVDAIEARERQGKGPIDYGAEAERFVNHFVGNGKPMKDWRRTWLNWCTSPFVDQLKQGKGTTNGSRASKTIGSLLDGLGGGPRDDRGGDGQDV